MSLGAMQEGRSTRPTLELDNGAVMEYVGGPHPYLWIGKPDGTYLASVDIDPLKNFIGPLRRARKEKVES